MGSAEGDNSYCEHGRCHSNPRGERNEGKGEREEDWGDASDGERGAIMEMGVSRNRSWEVMPQWEDNTVNQGSQNSPHILHGISKYQQSYFLTGTSFTPADSYSKLFCYTKPCILTDRKVSQLLCTSAPLWWVDRPCSAIATSRCIFRMEVFFCRYNYVVGRLG